LLIVATPNHSSSWQANKWLLVALSIPSLGIATGFAVLGAWPILPLAGLELGALGSALYLVNWNLQYRHVITLSAEAVQVEKGHYMPRQRWRLNREKAGLSIEQERHPWEGPVICLHDHHREVHVGDFLNRKERLELMELLRAELRVTGYAKCVLQRF